MQMRSESDNQNSVISFVPSKWLLPELSIPAAGQKDRRLWGRECIFPCMSDRQLEVLSQFQQKKQIEQYYENSTPK